MTVILGLSAFYHDSAAALIVDGRIAAAAQEERFTRRKHDSCFPSQAIMAVLAQADIDISAVDYVVFYEKPHMKFARLLLNAVALAPRGLYVFLASMRLWLGGKLWHRRLIQRHLRRLVPSGVPLPPISFADHHTSHAASAYYPSPFEEAVVLTIDGVGECATTTVSLARGRNLRRTAELRYPHSLGLLYSSFTQYIGFKVNSGEYKLMGLAPYGQPKYAQVILDTLVDVKEDGSFRLNMLYFGFPLGRRMINEEFAALFGVPARTSEDTPITQFHMDIAASIQAVTENLVMKMAQALARKHDCRNLCLAGGVALNCVANSKLRASGLFEAIWVQPAAGDAGGAIGAALWYWHEALGQPRVAKTPDAMVGTYLGPEYNDAAIAKSLTECGAIFHSLPRERMLDVCVLALRQGQAVGWFQGRMEFGPRALGARSILADPRGGDMQKTLNLKIKKRESFRPFAPAVLAELASDWFANSEPSPYMLFTTDVVSAPGSIPAVTHVDGSARAQTVDGQYNPLFHDLLSQFNEATGCPVLANTSFNVRGEPIVQSPKDAWSCFMATGLDLLVIGNHVLHKHEQTGGDWRDHDRVFDPD